MIIKLTSAVAGRAAVYLNALHIVSFGEQTGGCLIKVSSSGSSANTIAVTENAETVLQRIEEARLQTKQE